MISLVTDYTRLIISKALKTSTTTLDDVQNRLSTGLKLNCAKDNAANYSISTNLTTKLGAYRVAEDNIKMGLDLVQTATGSLSLIEDKLVRLRSLAVQAKNGTYGSQSLAAINSEANALVDEIDRLQNSTEYNGVDLYSNGVNISSLVKAGEDGFINHVEKRDTSSMTKLSEVDGLQKLAKGTYSISTPEELKKLGDMVDAGNITRDSEFVLANDIDLSCYDNWTPIGKEGMAFSGTFDGNGYVIDNMKITQAKQGSRYSYAGLFAFVYDVNIKNLGITNVSLEDKSAIYAGAIFASSYGSNTNIISNCYSTGNIIGNVQVGGLGAWTNALKIENCYSEANVTGVTNAGGLLSCGSDSVINCYATGNVKASLFAGGLIGRFIPHTDSSSVERAVKNSSAYGDVSSQAISGGLIGRIEVETLIEDCSAYGQISIYDYRKDIFSKFYASGLVGLFSNGGTIKNCVTYSLLSKKQEDANLNLATIANSSGAAITVENCIYNSKKSGINYYNGDDSLINKESLKDLAYSNEISLQIGTNENENSNLTLDSKILLDKFGKVRAMNILNDNYLTAIDDLISQVSDYQTNLGATENRLTSALDEVGISYENVLSTRSTLRDADVAKISSEYVQQQILQQASATLLSTTANFRRENILALIQGIR